MDAEVVKVVTHKTVVTKLEKAGSWHIITNGHSLTMSRLFNGRDMTVKLERCEDGLYMLTHPGYDYVSPNSHFASTIAVDKRLCLNKALLKSFVTTLRNAEVWQLIKNKDFLKVNDANKKSKKVKVTKELEDLIS